MDNDVFLAKYEKFLRDANTNLGRHSPRREGFINEALSMIKDFVGCASEKPVKKTTLETLQADRVIRMKPTKQTKKLSTKDGGAAVMTESESMRADEELGNSPF